MSIIRRCSLSLQGRSGSGRHLAVWTISRQVARRQSRRARIQRTPGLVGLWRRTTSAAVDEVTDLAAVGDVPDHTGFMPLVGRPRRHTAAQIGASSREAGQAEKNGQRKGLHDEEDKRMNDRNERRGLNARRMAFRPRRLLAYYMPSGLVVGGPNQASSWTREVSPSATGSEMGYLASSSALL